ncbi:MAG: hypothetical protein AB1423_07370 [Pseudomonadota bacterium]
MAFNPSFTWRRALRGAGNQDKQTSGCGYKEVSDLEGDLYEKRAIIGHKNIEQTAVYDRKITIIPVVGAQKLIK